MPIPDTEEGRKKLVLRAMRALAPEYLRRLEAAGELEAVLAERAELMVEVEDTLADQALNDEPQHLPYLERVGWINNAMSRAAEVAIAEATEFPSEEPSTE
jgi:hypothetical protein